MESPSHQGARDTFLYLLALITLIVSAVAFGTIVYQIIDHSFPDVLNIYASNLSGIRIALAALVVVFPVFYFTSRFLYKDVTAHPAKRDARIRRWLMYLTVFVAALTVIGDLVTLLFNFLQGDLTTSFVLKIITVFFIAGSAFWYYLAELQNRRYPRVVFQTVVVAVVVCALGYGFYLAGSPASQRLIRFDDQNVSNLALIQNQIIFYWQQKGVLPTQLSDLNDPISGFSVPVNPQANTPYGYSVTGPYAFQLCAFFNRATSPDDQTVQPAPEYPASDSSNNSWDHGTGTVCFDRTIDLALYPVTTPQK